MESTLCFNRSWSDNKMEQGMDTSPLNLLFFSSITGVKYNEKKMLLNQKHFFRKACILLIHKNILQEPINMLLIL